MRTYMVNPDNEKRYELECTNLKCKYSPDAVITVVWKKEYMHDMCCDKCGKILTETMSNWKPMPALRQPPVSGSVCGFCKGENWVDKGILTKPCPSCGGKQTDRITPMFTHCVYTSVLRIYTKQKIKSID